MNNTKLLLKTLLGSNVVRYYPSLAEHVGGAKAALMLSQLLYWDSRDFKKLPGDFFWVGVPEMQEQTGLTKGQQQTARKRLLNHGVIKAELKGVPPRWRYKPDLDKLGELIGKPPVQRTGIAPFEENESSPTTEANPSQLNEEDTNEETINNNDIGFSEVIKTYESLTGTINPFISEQLGVIYDELLVHIVALPVSHPDANKSPSELLVAAIVHMGKHADRPSIAYLEKVVDGWKRHGVGSKPPGKRTNNRKLARQSNKLPDGMTVEDLEKAGEK